MNPAEMSLNPITQFDPTVIVAVMLIVTVMYVALRRVFVLPYLRVMDEREDVFEAADAKHAQADEARRAADLEAEAALSRAAQTAEETRAQAKERAETYRRQRIEEATRLASEHLEEGRAQIAADRELEVERLRDHAIDCVGLACEQLLGKAEPDLVGAAVERAMTRRIQ